MNRTCGFCGCVLPNVVSSSKLVKVTSDLVVTDDVLEVRCVRCDNLLYGEVKPLVVRKNG